MEKKKVKTFTRKDLPWEVSFYRPGDFVKCGVHWEEVTKVNAVIGIMWCGLHMVTADMIWDYIRVGVQ